jgi:hypothetical protein
MELRRRHGTTNMGDLYSMSFRKILGLGLLGVMLATPLVTFAQQGGGQKKGGKRKGGGGKKGGKKGPAKKGGRGGA